MFNVAGLDGAVLSTGMVAALPVCSSDASLKKNITTAGNVLFKFLLIPIKEYDVISSNEHKTGVVAQRLQVGESGFGICDGWWTVGSPATEYVGIRESHSGTVGLLCPSKRSDKD